LKDAHLPSLGDPSVVAGLVREFLRGAVDRVADVGSSVLAASAAGLADVDACRGMAAIFLGQHERYAAVAGWNTGGGMVGWMLEQLSHVYKTPDTDAARERIVGDVFAHAVQFAREAVVFHAEIETEEHGPLLDDLSNLADDLTCFLLGTAGHFPARLSL
jgi:hypothetical protein